VGSDPEIRARIDGLDERVKQRFEELREAIAAYQSEGFNAARHAVSTNQGRRLMNEMRRLVGEMQTIERVALRVRSAESRQSAKVTSLANLVGSMVGIGLVLLAFTLFRRELTQRRRAGDALRRLAAIVESSDDAIISKNMEGMIVSWNAGAMRIYGYTAEEVIGRPVALLCPPDRVDEVAYTLDRIRKGNHIEHFETTRVRKDRRQIDVSLRISPINDESGAVIGASEIARDITEQRLLEREVLEIAAREQQRIGQDLHDGTGQELTGLAMMAERLAGELTRRTLPEAEMAAKIVDGLEEALWHVRALSKGLVPVELDAEGLMAALVSLAERTSELPGVHCTFRCDKPVAILDNQTATHLYRLSQESVTNALKHGGASNIVISLSDDGVVITLKITDDGVGIDCKNPETVGTGLQIMRYRAKLIRAKLTISPIKPHGTQVVCTLPRGQAAWTGRPPTNGAHATSNLEPADARTDGQ
jgi:PAS domain S-box-containing protein